MHVLFPHMHLLGLGLIARRQLRLCFLWLTVKLVSLMVDLPKISFFNVLKHTCLIISSIDFLIQPTDLNEVF